MVLLQQWSLQLRIRGTVLTDEQGTDLTVFGSHRFIVAGNALSHSDALSLIQISISGDS